MIITIIISYFGCDNGPVKLFGASPGGVSAGAGGNTRGGEGAHRAPGEYMFAVEITTPCRGLSKPAVPYRRPRAPAGIHLAERFVWGEPMSTEEHQGDAEDKRARMLAGLRTGNGRPELARLSHQTRRWLERSMSPCCDRCVGRATCDLYQAGGTCVIAEQYQADLLAALECEVEITPALRPVATEYARIATALAIAQVFLAQAGPFLPGAENGYIEGQPILQRRDGWSSRLQSLANDLGLTPAAKHRMRANEKTTAGDILAAALAEAKRGEPVREGEFEPIPEGQEVGADGTDAEPGDAGTGTGID